MGINQLPPQAYTRETLMQAFDWIKTQPRQVQDLASSTDALVSIYMQARRRAGNHGVTHPVSSQSFKQDLKNLAEGLRQFEDDGAAAAADAAQTTYVAPAGAPAMHASAQPAAPMQGPPPYQAPQQQQQAAQFHAPPQQQTAASQLDAKSLDVVRQVQSRFNLSSENEALRMLISFGFEKVREISPKS